MFKTYQTKIKNKAIVLTNNQSTSIYQFLENTAKTFGSLERKLFVDLYVHKKSSNELKVSYCSKYQITSRQYNSIKKQLDGRISSKLELQKLHMEETKNKIEITTNIINKKRSQKEKAHASLLKMKGNEKTFLKKVKNYRKLRNYIHQKKRKLYAWTIQLEKLERDQKQQIVRICFGSKEFFSKQFNLEENNLTFQEWKTEWQARRAAQFTCIGSKDEIFGNQSCTYDLKNNLRIRVYTKDEKVYGNYVVIPNVLFPYGQEHIDRAKIPSVGYTKGKGNKVTYYRATTWKFMRKHHSWYVHVTVDVDAPDVTTVENNGVIGIDLNAGFLAIADVDRFGNYNDSFQIPYKANHASSEETKQSLSEALKVVVEYAKNKQKPIAKEKLDFKKKKQNLKQMSPQQAKMLSGFAYSSYQSLLESKCEMAGVKLFSVNPAFTSQIGHHKFMKKYGLSSHESAAMVIGRRSLEFKKVEQVPTKHFLTGKKEKIIVKSRWNQWKELVKQWKKYGFYSKIYALNRL